MENRLKDLRRASGILQDEMAARVSELMGEQVKPSRYGTWERGERMVSLEQAYYCAVALGVTLNDLVGMRSPDLTQGEADLLAAYRACSDGNRDAIRQVAKSLSYLPPGPEYTLVKVD